MLKLPPLNISNFIIANVKKKVHIFLQNNELLNQYTAIFHITYFTAISSVTVVNI